MMSDTTEKGAVREDKPWGPADFVTAIQGARAVEVRGSLYVKDADTLYVLDPNADPMRAGLMLPDAPLMVVCHRSRAEEVRKAVEGLREPAFGAAHLSALAFTTKLSDARPLQPEQRNFDV